jgi:hypothetical protein
MGYMKRVLFTLLLAAGLPAPGVVVPAQAGNGAASIEVQNRSGYDMTFVAWNDGKSCTEKAILPAGMNINSPQASKIQLPAGKPVAVGVGIFDMQGKAPVVCDYIMSFVLAPDSQYRLEYDIHNRRCFAQLFRLSQGTFQMVIPGDAEDFHEKVPEFGWDQFEPGCSGE